MYIPYQFRKKEWRRFFAGVVVGAVIGYLLFLFIYGQWQEKYTEEHIELTSELNEIENKYQNLLKNPNDDTEEEKQLTVLEIKVTYTNAKKLEVDLLTQHQLTAIVKEQLQSIPGKSVDDVAKQVDLMQSTIENKNFIVDDFTYHLNVTKLIVSEVVHFHLEIELKH